MRAIVLALLTAATVAGSAMALNNQTGMACTSNAGGECCCVPCPNPCPPECQVACGE